MTTEFRKASACAVDLRLQSGRGRAKRILTLSGSLAAVTAQAAFAANGTWTGAGADSLWTNPANWTAVPGAVGGTFANTDIATFNDSSPAATVAVDTDRGLGGFTYDNSLANFIIGAEGVNAGQALHLTGGGLTQATAAVAPAAPQNFTINSPVILAGNSYTFAHNSLSANTSLLVRGNITGSASGLTTLTLDGTHASTTNASLRGTIADGAGGTMGITKQGTGFWEIITNSATPNTYSGDTFINGGTLRVVNDALEGNDGAGGLSPNSNYIVNSGGTLQVRVIGNTARSVTVKTGGTFAVTTAGATIVSLKNNNGPALTLDYSTLVGDTAVSLPISLTGTVAGQGGVKYIGNAQAGIVGIGATTSAFDLGTVMRPMDIGKGRSNDTVTQPTPYDVRFRGPVTGGGVNGGITKIGAGILRFDNAANTFTGTLEIREGEVRANVSNGLTGLPKLLVNGGAFNTTGGQTQTFGATTVTKGSLLGSNTTSIVLAPTFAFNVATGDTATISATLGNAPSTTTTVTKTGAGLAVMSGLITYSGTTTVNGGTLQLNENAQPGIIGSDTQTASSAADVKSGRLVFFYDVNTSSALKVIPLLHDAYPGNFTSGPIRSSSADGTRGLGYADDTVNHMFTVQSALYGDANLDATVDFNDLVIIAQNYNGTGKTWSQGDSTYDSNVDFNDLVKLAQNYNKSVTTEGSLLGLQGFSPQFQSDWALAQTMVPEPTLLSAAAASLSLIVRRRR